MSDTSENTSGFEHLASDEAVLEPPTDFSAHAVVDSMGAYRAAYERSVTAPSEFWLEAACEDLEWVEQPTRGLEGGFENLDYT